MSELEAGFPHRTLRPLELKLVDAAGTRTRTLQAGELFKPWAIRESQLEITLGELANEFVSTPAAHFFALEAFHAHCEPTPRNLPSGAAEAHNILGQMLDGAPHFLLIGHREDVDAGLKPNRLARWRIDLEEAMLLCETLAFGGTRRLDRTRRGSLCRLEWTLDDPRHEFDRVETTLALQLLWFFPGAEDLTAFRMNCTELIEGLGREVAWLLRLPEQNFRSQLNAMAVWLDQAAARCEL